LRLQYDADEEYEPDPGVVEKCPQAAFPCAVPDQKVLVTEQSQHRGQCEVIESTESAERPEQRQGRERAGLQGPDHEPVRVAEQDRRGLDADPQIVVAIDHRVHRVVGDNPEHAGHEQQPRLARQCRLDARISHQQPPAECSAEHDLRQVGPAFHERIRDGDGEAADGEPPGQGVQEHQQQESGE